MSKQFKSEQGFLTFALGNNKDYLKLAYLQALSIKVTQKNAKYAVVVEKSKLEKIDHKLFDEVIAINYVAKDWDMSQHYRAFALSPWRETILLDADIIFPTSIDHWWPVMRNLDVCITSKIHNYKEEIISSRACRKLFDENLLPNVYGAFMYFRYTLFANDFFQKMKQVTTHWDWFANTYLIKNDDKRPRLDEILAITTKIVGEENCTLPINVPTFVHAKNELLDLSNQLPWHEQVYVEWDQHIPLIDHFKQRLPLHYHCESFVTDDIIRNFERHYKKFN